MRFHLVWPVLAAAAILSPAAPAAAATCLGFFNQREQGFKLEGGRLEPSGSTVAAGSEFEFNGITKIGSAFYLTRARDDVIYDAENVELTGGCDLPTVQPRNAR